MSWQNRTMTPVEYRRAIHTLHLNKAQAGRYLGYGVRTAHRFWDGDAKVPVSVALLLRALIHFHEQPEVPPYEGIKAKRRREAAEKLAIAP